jgi:hypothetical protein
MVDRTAASGGIEFGTSNSIIGIGTRGRRAADRAGRPRPDPARRGVPGCRRPRPPVRAGRDHRLCRAGRGSADARAERLARLIPDCREDPCRQPGSVIPAGAGPRLRPLAGAACRRDRGQPAPRCAGPPVHFGDGGVADSAAAWKVPGQGNRLKPVGGPGRDLRGSWAGAMPNPSAMSRMSPPGPFLPRMIGAIAAGAAGG